MRAAKKLGEILVDLRVLKYSDVERILTAQRRRGDHTKFGEMARNMGLLREEHILAALAVQLQLVPEVQRSSLDRILNSLQGRKQPGTAPVKTGR
jgi:hypothetical protein